MAAAALDYNHLSSPAASSFAFPHQQRSPYGVASPTLAEQPLRNHNHNHNHLHHPALVHPHHSHSRTSSSNTFPADYLLSRRTPALNSAAAMTTSPSSPSSSSSRPSRASNAYNQQRQSSQSAASAARSSTSAMSISIVRTSSSSQDSAYVATLRRQKATVWSDRSQKEDPRLLAQQKAAKLKAAMEVHGSAAASHLSFSGTSSSSKNKIQHKGVNSLKRNWNGSATGLEGSLVVNNVPARLSATEVHGDSSDDDDDFGAASAGYGHRRTGSGRSSLNSMGRRRRYGGPAPGAITPEERATSMYSNNSGHLHKTESPDQRAFSLGNSHNNRLGSMDSAKLSPGASGAYLSRQYGEPHYDDTPRPGGRDYFASPDSNPQLNPNTGTPMTGSSGETASTSSSSDALYLQGATSSSSARPAVRHRGSTGSLIEHNSRTMTMGVKLFVANPDMD